MKCIVLPIAFFTLFSFCVTGFVAVQAVNSSEPMDENNYSKIVTKISQGYVVIDDQKRSLFIDYRKKVLSNHVKETDVCQQFDISYEIQEDNFISERIKLFGEFRFIEKRQSQEKNEQMYSISTVIHAPRAMMLKGVTTARLELFGISFIPRITEYVLDQNYSNFDALVEVAQYNASLGEINPLVFQLDLTHLFSRFAGVPVRKRYENETTELSFSIVKEKTLREMQPQQCSDE